MFNGRYTADGFEYIMPKWIIIIIIWCIHIFVLNFETIEVYLQFEHANNIILIWKYHVGFEKCFN